MRDSQCLSERRKQIGRKYDYRYSQLRLVLGRLLYENRLREDDLSGLREDKMKSIVSYWVWGSKDDWSVIREEPLKEIDRAIDLARQHGIHINLNFHRIPGYCING